MVPLSDSFGNALGGRVFGGFSSSSGCTIASLLQGLDLEGCSQLGGGRLICPSVRPLVWSGCPPDPALVRQWRLLSCRKQQLGCCRAYDLLSKLLAAASGSARATAWREDLGYHGRLFERDVVTRMGSYWVPIELQDER